MTATTGEVHLTPVRAEVVADRALEPSTPDGPTREVHPGDLVWVLAFLGEGQAEVWVDGAVYVGDLSAGSATTVGSARSRTSTVGSSAGRDRRRERGGPRSPETTGRPGGSTTPTIP
ncbi:MAG: hypothetical protein ABMB14_15370 [Myxococcota bacterium]